MWTADISPDEATTEVRRVIPAIFGQDGTLQLAKQLRGKVKQILTSLSLRPTQWSGNADVAEVKKGLRGLNKVRRTTSFSDLLESQPIT